jgi:hypothetical protein
MIREVGSFEGGWEEQGELTVLLKMCYSADVYFQNSGPPPRNNVAPKENEK